MKTKTNLYSFRKVYSKRIFNVRTAGAAGLSKFLTRPPTPWSIGKYFVIIYLGEIKCVSVLYKNKCISCALLLQQRCSTWTLTAESQLKSDDINKFLVNPVSFGFCLALYTYTKLVTANGTSRRGMPKNKYSWAR